MPNRGAQCFGEYVPGEARVLLRSQSQKFLAAVAAHECVDVNEITSCSTPEQSEHLVRGHLVRVQHAANRELNGVPDPGVLRDLYGHRMLSTHRDEHPHERWFSAGHF